MPTLGSLPGSIPISGSLLSRTSVLAAAHSAKPLASDLSANASLVTNPAFPNSATTNNSQIIADATAAISRVNDPLAVPAGRGVNNSQTDADQAGTVEAQRQGQTAQESKDQKQLARQELAQVQQLAQIDRDVRAHEATHAAVGGGLAGAPNYEYTQGPDGRRYATAGEVSIDTSPVHNDAQATVDKAQTIIQAALAPRNPSSQDLSVAAQAQALLVEAQAQLVSEVREQQAQARGQGQDAAQASSEQSSAQPGEQVSELDAATTATATATTATATAQERLERAREQREDFARQVQALNSRLSSVQQQVVESGAIASVNVRGGFIDIQA